MLVELTVNWAYVSPVVAPYPVNVYWKLKGAATYQLFFVAGGTTANITTLSNSASTLDTACTLEYEGYVIPVCFVDSTTDCDEYNKDGTINTACAQSDRIYWNATINATDNQTCRGVQVTCQSSGVYAIHAVNQTQFFAQQWLAPGPVVEVTNPGTGTLFSAVPAAGAYNSSTGFMVKDCWEITQGNGYTTTPTVTLSRSNAGVAVAMEVTMACNDFTYQDCKTPSNILSGPVLLGESRTVCTSFSKVSTFIPTAVNSVFVKTLAGCCSGNGQKYTFTFTSPDPAVYPTVKFTYLGAVSGGSAQTVATLFHGVPYPINDCIVIDSINAFTSTAPVACTTDKETNIWLFDNHVLITPGVLC